MKTSLRKIISLLEDTVYVLVAIITASIAIVINFALFTIPIWCVIWAINVLFGTQIEFTFTTWLATFILLAIVSPKSSNK